MVSEVEQEREACDAEEEDRGGGALERGGHTAYGYRRHDAGTGR